MDKPPMESDPSVLSCHYIAKKNTILSRIAGACESNVCTLRLGMLVEVNEVQADGGLRIRVNDANDQDFWRKTEWRCHKIDLIRVPTLVWQFLAAIPTPQNRVDIASDPRLCEEAAKFKQGSSVWYQPPSKVQRSLAIIRYIGPVKELGQGFHFGLELLENREPTQTSVLAKRYITTFSGHFTLATLSDVHPFHLELADGVKNIDLTKSSSAENVSLTNEYVGPPKSLSHNHITNGKRIQPDFCFAFDEGLNIFDDRNNNNNGDASSHLSNALIPKIAHKSAKSKILVSDASSSVSRNHDSFDFLGNDCKQ